jgi:hypothetical protein
MSGFAGMGYDNYVKETHYYIYVIRIVLKLCELVKVESIHRIFAGFHTIFYRLYTASPDDAPGAGLYLHRVKWYT